MSPVRRNGIDALPVFRDIDNACIHIAPLDCADILGTPPTASDIRKPNRATEIQRFFTKFLLKGHR